MYERIPSLLEPVGRHKVTRLVPTRFVPSAYNTCCGEAHEDTSDRIVPRPEIGRAWHDHCSEVVSVGVQSNSGTAHDIVV